MKMNFIRKLNVLGAKKFLYLSINILMNSKKLNMINYHHKFNVLIAKN